MKKKSKFFIKKTNSKWHKNTEVIKEDISQLKNILEEVNLKKIQHASKVIYNHNITDNMIKYIKSNNNINIKYDIWLKQFNEADYIQEFEDKTRDNKIYHDIWMKLFNHEGYEIIY